MMAKNQYIGQDFQIFEVSNSAQTNGSDKNSTYFDQTRPPLVNKLH